MTAPLDARASPPPSNASIDVPFWSQATLTAIQALSSAKVFPPAVRLIEQGSVVGTVYLIERGIVKLLRWEAGADRETVVALRYAGWLLGSGSVILEHPSPVTAQTLIACRVWEIRSARFLAEMKKNPALSWQIHLLHSRWLHDQFGQLARLKALSARRRLERLLGELCKMQAPPQGTKDDPLRIQPHLKHSELAEALMVSAQHLSRLLGELESEGVLRREKGWLVVSEPAKLSPS